MQSREIAEGKAPRDLQVDDLDGGRQFGQIEAVLRIIQVADHTQVYVIPHFGQLIRKLHAQSFGTAGGKGICDL